ncbi:hypothetical protein E2320_005796 [Naja naja]|nr:hypothetical protein E2320_005796 [Naja naja]
MAGYGETFIASREPHHFLEQMGATRWRRAACLMATGRREAKPTSDSVARIPERTLYRQSLPPLAKLRPPSDKSIKRREPKRKSLTFTGGAKGLMDIFGKSKDSEFKQKVLHCKTTADELKKLVRLQAEKLQSALDSTAEIRYWEQKFSLSLEDDILKLEQKLKRNEVEIEEEEFWENEFQIEQENEKQLREQLLETRQRVADQSRLRDYLAQIRHMESGLEAEKLQREVQEAQVNEEEVREKIEKIRGELQLHGQQSLRLENGLKAVERSLGQATKQLQNPPFKPAPSNARVPHGSFPATFGSCRTRCPLDLTPRAFMYNGPTSFWREPMEVTKDRNPFPPAGFLLTVTYGGKRRRR